MAKMHKPGDRVKAKTSHPAVRAGQTGHVVSTHVGTFHAVHMGTGTVFMPASNLAPYDPDNDNDVDVPGQPDNDAPMMKH